MYNNRRILHQPFFPSQTPPPPSSPPFPKYPSSSNPGTPFFPEYPSPPPPPSSAADPTIPANISSLTYPNSSSSSHSAPHSHSKLLLSVLFSLIALSLLILSLSFLFHRRRRRSTGPASSKPEPAKPPVPPPATSPAPPPPPTADFLYLGTVVNSRPIGGQTVNASSSPPSPYRKPGSPELRPLPPLSRNLKPNYRNATDSDDEFYSPKGSENGASATGSSSRGVFEAVADKCGFRSSDLSSPSYPDSNSAGSGSPSPIGSSPAKDPRSATPSPPAPPPPPPPPMRPMTPSPPKRKPPSPSPPLSPVVKGSRVSARSPARFNQSEGNSRNQAPPAAAAPPPPPPPPPPPVGYWERQVRKRPAVTTPKSVVLKGPVDFIEDSDSLEKNEETPRPKLKPLHWDKVRASSDRAMVWDQLKSSSFK